MVSPASKRGGPSAAPTPQWVIDLKNLPSSKPKPSPSIPDPPGFTSGPGSGGNKKLKPSPTTPTPPSTPEATADLFIKKAWEIAIAPAKSLPMNFIMMYMSGNSLQIFSIMMTFMLFMNPIKALSSVQSTFRRFENDDTRSRLWVVKGAYVALQILSLAFGVWKVNGMGLLPTTRSDWLAWEKERIPMEYSPPVFT